MSSNGDKTVSRPISCTVICTRLNEWEVNWEFKVALELDATMTPEMLQRYPFFGGVFCQTIKLNHDH